MIKLLFTSASEQKEGITKVLFDGRPMTLKLKKGLFHDIKFADNPDEEVPFARQCDLAWAFEHMLENGRTFINMSKGEDSSSYKEVATDMIPTGEVDLSEIFMPKWLKKDKYNMPWNKEESTDKE